MGVYHLMGLGQSPGTVTAPLSYLANRYHRWHVKDRDFFARSGEVSQKEQGKKVGDVQAIILFTTAEVLSGVKGGKPFFAYSFIDNQAKSIQGKEQPRSPMKDVLRSLIPKTCKEIFGGRQTVDIFWCEIDRKNTQLAYERIVKVITALSTAGGQGKEMWVNLTGGNNITNFALQLAATLSGNVARLYYIQAQNEEAEKCIRFTSDEDYWIELPIMPLVLNDLNLAVLDLLEENPGLGEKEICSRLQNHDQHWKLVSNISTQGFREAALVSMWKQGLIEGESDCYCIGASWKLIQRYSDCLQEVKTKMEAENITLETLAKQVKWIERDTIHLKY